MNARIDASREISLISYLSGSKDSPPVGLSLEYADPSSPDRSLPFNILHDSDPLTRVVRASFVTDNGCELKKVFLLLQKDRYGIKRDELWPLTNRDIDEAWQRAFSLQEVESDDSSRIQLSCQMGDDGLPNLFSSLFYCTTRRIYFSPPCPQCGNPLTLCRDDDLLLSSALHPYSTSTKRYLHCVSCCTQGAKEFYVREKGDDDQDTLCDLPGLITRFSRLQGGTDPAGCFPCGRCPEHGNCYGASRGAVGRIVPFSFYPFHMLIFESMSLPAMDFLPLISGASIDDLQGVLSARGEKGRMSCLDGIKGEGLAGVSLFPVDDERYFLEVLFLKLSFLGDLFMQAFPRSGIAGQPELRLAIDRIWVRLPGQSGLLPSFWNFRTKFLDIVRPDEIEQFFSGPSLSHLLHGALLWFYTLMVNKGQESRGVMLSLKGALSDPDSPSALFSNPVFSPEQIFWNPDGMRVNRKWLPLWEQSIEMGLDLLQSAVQPDRQWSFTEFMAKFENLRADVRSAMLVESPPATEMSAQVQGPDGDDAIRKILTGIIHKWRDMGEPEPKPEPPGQDSDMMETVILASDEIAAPVSPASDEEEWTETVVLTARAVKPEPPPVSKRAPGSVDVLETVVLAGGGARAEKSISPPPVQGGDAVLETVMMTPGVRPEETYGPENVPDAGAGSEEEGKKEAANGEALLETVVLNPRKDKVKAKGWKD